MLLSDRDIRAALDDGRIVLEPRDDAMVQPSSVDVRLDRYFRVFENHRYPHIDPAQEQSELTRLVEPDGAEPFILHPGEFVLGSTYEGVTLPDDVAARLEGKALALGTPVPTPDGWRTMADLRPGDRVFDETGAPTLVVAATVPTTGRPCFEVEFSDGTVLVADDAHQWMTTTKAERSHGRPRSGVRSTEELARTVRVRGESNHHVRLAGPVQQPWVELPIDPYVLGLWLGEGSPTTGVLSVGPGDEQLLHEVEAAGYAVCPTGRRMAYRIGGLSRRAASRRSDSKDRFSGAASLTTALRGMALLGDKHVPADYLAASVPQRLALLQGLMDSSGYVDADGRCEFVSTSECLADAVVLLAASLGLRPAKRKKRALLGGVDCGPAYQVDFTSRIPVFRLERKVDRLKAANRPAPSFRAIVGVRPVPSVDVRCIRVAAASGLFLVGPTYIPTHNSSLGRLGLLTHSTAGFIDPGFSGHVTLELSNVATLPIKLWPGMKIGQMCFFRLSSPAEHSYGSERYGSRYQGQRGPTASRSHVSFHRTEV
jgi:deoxycytidine triphosphate deaminase